jgi:hypothetical protein
MAATQEAAALSNQPANASLNMEQLPARFRINAGEDSLLYAPFCLGGNMRSFVRFAGVFVYLLVACAGWAWPNPADDHSSVVLIFKDGHRQSFAVAEIERIDLKAPSAIVFKDGHQEKVAAADIARIEFESSGLSAMAPGRSHFIGKWEVGEGANGSTFFITLDADGSARKTLGAAHGTWTLVDGEARIAWDDGWHDVIRKVGTTHEKRAYEPGKSLDDQPSNVTAARNTQPKPI